MGRKNILIIEDEKDIQEIVSDYLGNEGFSSIVASSSAEGIDALRNDKIDLILLDVMLPDIDGFSLCKLLKGGVNTKYIPIIMMTAQNKSSDIVEGLSLGADDYVTKPFDLDVLLARIKAVLRRGSEFKVENISAINIDDIEIYPESRKVIVDSKEVYLTNLEFQALCLLANSPGRVFTRDQISDNIRKDASCPLDRSIDSIIVRLRKKLNPDKNYIETMWGVGYRFKEQ